jgi:hypothetical protein
MKGEISMKEYKIKTQFMFEGNFYIKANDKIQAKEYVEKHCGLTLCSSIHSTLPDDIVDWDFPVHPKKLTGKISLMKGTVYKGFPAHELVQKQEEV